MSNSSNRAVAAAFGLPHGEAKALMTDALAAGLVEQRQNGPQVNFKFPIGQEWD